MCSDVFRFLVQVPGVAGVVVALVIDLVEDVLGSGFIVCGGVPTDDDLVAGGFKDRDGTDFDGGRFRVCRLGSCRHIPIVQRVLDEVSGLVKGSYVKSVFRFGFQAFKGIGRDAFRLVDLVPGVARDAGQLTIDFVDDTLLSRYVVGSRLPFDGDGLAGGPGYGQASVRDCGRHRVRGQGFRAHAPIDKRILANLAGLVISPYIKYILSIVFEAGERVGIETFSFLDGFPIVSGPGIVIGRYTDSVDDGIGIDRATGPSFPGDGDTVARDLGDVERLISNVRHGWEI